MLHTFVGSDDALVRATVREPFKRYLESSVDLWKREETRFEDMSPRKRADLLEFAFERYYRKTGLMGTVDACRTTVEAVSRSGVDEIACLIDFGIPRPEVMDGLRHLAGLVTRHSIGPSSVPGSAAS
jgi:hypothetical protein